VRRRHASVEPRHDLLPLDECERGNAIDAEALGDVRALVDVDERPDIAERFCVDRVPALALVKGKKVVARLDGRVTTPHIEAMLESFLDPVA